VGPCRIQATRQCAPPAFDPVSTLSHCAGENYDATLVQAGWDRCGFFPTRNMTSWTPVVPDAKNPTANASFNAYHQPVRPDRPYSPLNIAEVSAGTYVADFGQNMAGIVTLRVACNAPGRVINLK
jgi:alpha-L-rhamnosidase